VPEVAEPEVAEHEVAEHEVASMAAELPTGYKVDHGVLTGEDPAKRRLTVSCRWSPQKAVRTGRPYLFDGCADASVSSIPAYSLAGITLGGLGAEVAKTPWPCSPDRARAGTGLVPGARCRDWPRYDAGLLASGWTAWSWWAKCLSPA
jgi:hypothetical protein